MAAIVSLVIAIICAVACRAIALKKNRGPLPWAVLGFFFGIIALIVIAAMKPKD